MNDNQVRIDITANAAGVKAGTDEAAREIGKLRGSAVDAAGGLAQAGDAAGAAEMSLGKLVIGVGLGSAAFAAAEEATRHFGAALNVLKESATLAARYETLGVVIDAVGRNAGYSSAEVRQYADDVRKMGITMLESRQTVASLAQAQIDLSHASELARIAQDAAVIGNINSSDALARLVHGLQTAQTDVLRSVGLNVSFEASYAALAAQLDKNANSLTEAEKATARLNAVKEAGVRIAGAYEESMGTAGKQMGSLARYSEDAKVKLGAVFDESLLLAVGAYTDALKGANSELDEITANKKLDEWASDVADSFAFIADAARYSFGVVFTAADTAYTALMQLSRFTVGDYKGILAAGDRFAERQSGFWSPENSMQSRLADLRAKREVDARTIYGPGGAVRYQWSSPNGKQAHLDMQAFEAWATAPASTSSKSTSGRVARLRQIDKEIRDLENMLATGQSNLMADFYEYRGDDDAATFSSDAIAKAEARSLKAAQKEEEAYRRAWDEYERSAARASERAAEKQEREFQRVADDINRSLTDAIMDGGMSGADFLERYFKTLILRPVISAVMDPVAKEWAGTVQQASSGIGDWLRSAFSSGYGDLSGMAAGVPQYATGTPYVPRDGLAYLHKAERVMTAEENAAYSKGGGGNVVVNVIEAPGKGGQTQERTRGDTRFLDVFVEQIKASIAGDVASGRGLIPASFEGAYGLNRGAGAY